MACTRLRRRERHWLPPGGDGSSWARGLGLYPTVCRIVGKGWQARGEPSLGRGVLDCTSGKMSGQYTAALTLVRLCLESIRIQFYLACW